MSDKGATSKYTDAAKDINKILKPEPPLNCEATDDTIKEELKEMVSGIVAEDDLSVVTWAVLKELGWKEPEKKATKKPEAKKPAATSTRPTAVFTAVSPSS